MPIGDSITAGYTNNPNWTVDFNHGFRSGLYTQLTGAGYDIQFVGGSTEPYDNAFPGDPSRGGTHTPAVDLAAFGQDGHRGYGGKATPFFLPRMLDAGARPGLLTVDDPDVILIHLGTNGRFTSELDTMLQGIFEARPDVGIVLAEIIPKAVYQPETVVYNDYLANTLLPKYQGLGAKITLADHYTPFLTTPNDPASINLSLMATGNHPNGAGYDVMAGVWFDAIERLLAPKAPGDFNGDGFVDAADYTAWESSFGLAGDLAADANGDSLIDGADYTVWRDAAAGPTASVPEPTALWLIACCLLGVRSRSAAPGSGCPEPQTTLVDGSPTLAGPIAAKKAGQAETRAVGRVMLGESPGPRPTTDPMKSRSTWLALIVAALFLTAQPAVAVLVVTDTTPYAQDFDFLSTSSGVAWVDDQATESTTGSPGWLWQSDGSDQPYDASAGGNATGSPYSYGAISDSDRAMGNLGGGDNDNTAWGLVMQNGGGGALTSLNVAFAAEQWRSPTGTATTNERVSFAYQVFSTEPTDLEISGGFVPTGWTEVASLGFSEISTTGSGAVDGNSATFRDELMASFAIDVPVGDYVALRWFDGDASSFDYGLAIDDLTVTVAAIPEPTATLCGFLLAAVLGTTLGRR